MRPLPFARLTVLAAFVLAGCGDDSDVPALDTSGDDVTDATVVDDTTNDVQVDTADTNDSGDTLDAADTEDVAMDAGDATDTADVTPDSTDATPDSADVEEDVPPSECGDGVITGDEACDDGNDDEEDLCLSSCELSYCGDGFVNASYGEKTFVTPRVVDFDGVSAFVCDDGSSCPADAGVSRCIVRDEPNATEHGICTSMRFERASVVEWGGAEGVELDQIHHAYNWECFNYVCEPGAFTSYDNDCGAGEMLIEISCEGIVDEECDDGDANAAVADACRPDCTLPRCGDAIVDSDEECDDGFAVNDDLPDTCRRDCSAPTCGDNILDTGEECDDGRDNGAVADRCRSNCMLPTCGDAVLDTGEECDDGNSIEDDGCSNLCRVPGCGDGVVQDALGEECDDGNDDDIDGCTNSCTIPRCGDGVVQFPEPCDDGNDDNSDACLVGCIAPTCGDSILSEYPQERTFVSPVVTGPTGATGHVCDSGTACRGLRCDVSDDGSADEHGICQSLGFERAVWVTWGGGDGEDDVEMPHAYNWACTDYECELSRSVIDHDTCDATQMLREIRCTGTLAEECDDGDANSDDERTSCRTTCQLPYCGDGWENPERGEQCDDGNTIANDECTNQCTRPTCGDGVWHVGEECDDGNDANDDLCLNSCLLATCGDGYLAETEQCDDGASNSDMPDALCRLDCTASRCGDGVTDSGEDCDDANTYDADLCNSFCEAAACGDGVRQRLIGEQCDDGNTDANDGCDATCLNEPGFADGHIVLIGHDFSSLNAEMETMVGNAVLSMSDIAGETLQVVGFDQYSRSPDTGSPARIDRAIRTVASIRGRDVEIQRASDADALAVALQTVDVLVLYEPDISSRTQMEAIAAGQGAAIRAFLDRGGVVVLTEARSNARYLLTAAEIVNITNEGFVSGRVDVVIPSHPVVEDMSLRYPAAGGTAYFETDAAGAEVLVHDSNDRAVVVYLRWP